MADAPQKEPTAQASILSPLRIVLLAILVLGGAALFFDLRSRNAARDAFAKVPQNLNEGPEKVAELIGRKADEEEAKSTNKIYIWRWPGVLNSYTVHAYFGEDDPKQLLQKTLNEPPAPLIAEPLPKP
jgi:hypothetical protein